MCVGEKAVEARAEEAKTEGNVMRGNTGETLSGEKAAQVGEEPKDNMEGGQNRRGGNWQQSVSFCAQRD